MNPQELGADRSLHSSTVNGQWEFRGGDSPEIDNNLLGLLNVQKEVVIFAPCGQLADLLPVVGLIVVGDETKVVSSVNFTMWLQLKDGAQWRVSSVKSRGPSTQPSALGGPPCS